LKLKYAAEKFENFITDPSQMEILKNINSLINKAFTVLTDPKLRIAYYRKLDIFSREVESKLLQMFEAEKIFEEGIYQFNGEKFDDSLNSFERAAALNPNEPEYSVWIGKSCFVLFLKDPQKNESLLNKAESLVNDALGKNPELVEGLLFKTSLLLHRERRDEAMSMVRQILKINPRHTEAKKIYRMISEKSAVKEAEKAIPEKKESFFEKIQSKLKKEVSKWLEKQKRTS
jgi:tetratricopeptide (TPR) repeat protein